jgi:hypothetical protein
MTDDKTTTKFCPGCGEYVTLYAVRAGQGVELRCTFCGIPLAKQSGASPTTRTLHGM